MAAMPQPQPALTIKRIKHFGDARDEQVFTSLSKGKREEAEFFAECNVEISFGKRTPFRDNNTFQVRAGQATHSGPLKDEVKVGEHYRYRVVPIKGPGADPEIIITN
jgi:hypothetical protein